MDKDNLELAIDTPSVHPTSPERKFTHAEIVAIAAKWCGSKHGVVLPEFVCQNSEIPDVLAMNGRETTMIEVKVSRSDFLHDKKKHFRAMEEYGMGNLRYYCAPKGMIHEDELPDGWGLIQISPQGKARLYVHALHKSTNYKAERHVLYSYARRAVVKGVHPQIMKSMAQDAADVEARRAIERTLDLTQAST